MSRARRIALHILLALTALAFSTGCSSSPDKGETPAFRIGVITLADEFWPEQRYGAELLVERPIRPD